MFKRKKPKKPLNNANNGDFNLNAFEIDFGAMNETEMENALHAMTDPEEYMPTGFKDKDLEDPSLLSELSELTGNVVNESSPKEPSRIEMKRKALDLKRKGDVEGAKAVLKQAQMEQKKEPDPDGMKKVVTEALNTDASPQDILNALLGPMDYDVEEEQEETAQLPEKTPPKPEQPVEAPVVEPQEADSLAFKRKALMLKKAGDIEGAKKALLMAKKMEKPHEIPVQKEEEKTVIPPENENFPNILEGEIETWLGRVLQGHLLTKENELYAYAKVEVLPSTSIERLSKTIRCAMRNTRPDEWPSYDWSCSLLFDSLKNLQRALSRKRISITLLSPRLLGLSSIPVARGEILLNETKLNLVPEYTATVPLRLVTSTGSFSRRPCGAELEVRLRVRRPLDIQSNQTRIPPQVQVKKKEIPKEETPDLDSIIMEFSNLGSLYSEGSTDHDADVKEMVSNDVLEHEARRVDEGIERAAKYIATKAKGENKVPSRLLERRTAVTVRLGLLVNEVQSGILSLPEYLDRLRLAIKRDKAATMGCLKHGKRDSAKILLKRVKIMEAELKGAEGI